MSTETFLAPDAGLISCDVFVREKVRGPEDVTCGFWDVVISTPAYTQGTPLVFVGLDGGERRRWPVPADWLLTVAGCEKIAVEFVEQLKKEGAAKPLPCD